MDTYTYLFIFHVLTCLSIKSNTTCDENIPNFKSLDMMKLIT